MPPYICSGPPLFFEAQASPKKVMATLSSSFSDRPFEERSNEFV